MILCASGKLNEGATYIVYNDLQCHAIADRHSVITLQLVLSFLCLVCYLSTELSTESEFHLILTSYK